MTETEPLLLDSITAAGAAARGRVVVSGSHGGVYPGWLAARAGVRAVIFNDAGGGLERAGVAGVVALGTYGVAAAAASHASCRIGDAHDMMARGRIAFANDPATALGVREGQAVAEAAARLRSAAPGSPAGFEGAEARREVALDGDGIRAVLMDSVSLLLPEDEGRIVVTGSHGGLVGGRPETAAKVAAAVLVFSDAGVGVDAAGLGRLPVLDDRGIAAVTVSHDSARIGDAGSIYANGVISHANATAEAQGLRPGVALRAALAVIRHG
jgi:hypothetical protein